MSNNIFEVRVAKIGGGVEIVHVSASSADVAAQVVRQKVGNGTGEVDAWPITDERRVALLKGKILLG